MPSDDENNGPIAAIQFDRLVRVAREPRRDEPVTPLPEWVREWIAGIEEDQKKRER